MIEGTGFRRRTKLDKKSLHQLGCPKFIDPFIFKLVLPYGMYYGTMWKWASIIILSHDVSDITHITVTDNVRHSLHVIIILNVMLLHCYMKFEEQEMRIIGTLKFENIIEHVCKHWRNEL